MRETVITVVGNVVDEPERRTTTSGVCVTSFRIAATERRRTQDAQWIDGDSLFLRVNCWRLLAENVVQCVHRGDPVMVRGRLFSREYERDGQRRNSYEVEAYEVGFDLTRGTAEFTRNKRPAVTFDVPEQIPAEDPEEGDVLDADELDASPEPVSVG